MAAVRLDDVPNNYLLALVKMHQGVEGVVSKEVRIFKVDNKRSNDAIHKLEKEKDEALEKNAKEVAAKTHWTVMGTISQYFSSGAMVAVGLSLGLTGWGTLLLASGIFGLGNRFVKDTVGWRAITSWFSKSVETQKKLAGRIESGLWYAEMGTGLCGGVGAAQAGAFTRILANPMLEQIRNIAQVIQLSGSGIQMTSQLGKTASEKRMNDLYATMRRLDAYSERISMDTTSEVTNLRNMMDTASSIGEDIEKTIRDAQIDI